MTDALAAQVSSRPKALIICGPTGVGKTAFSIALAQKFGGEIVGADSMQIYRQMDIGTAKPSAAERSTVAHHLVDIVDPDAPFDAQKYAETAIQIVSKLTAHGIIPLVVGGTGLYIKALVFGLFDAESANADLRERLKREAQAKGALPLYERLTAVDPDTARKLHPNDTHRVIRALEIYEISGAPLSAYHRRHRFQQRRLETLTLGLHMDREQLYQRIDARVDAMLNAGLLDEVRRLLDDGYSPDLKSMQSIGYRHMINFLHGRMNWEEAVRTLKRDTRRYAKRQLTWFKAVPDIVWLSPQDIRRAEALIRRFFV
jgi:tRNA dimethylallyltransferase